MVVINSRTFPLKYQIYTIISSIKSIKSTQHNYPKNHTLKNILQKNEGIKEHFLKEQRIKNQSWKGIEKTTTTIDQFMDYGNESH